MPWQERITELANGGDPRCIMQLPCGFLTMGDSQWLPGYCILIAYPAVDQLVTLEPDQRTAFLAEVGLLGEVVKKVTGAVRMNFGIYGNVDPFLHGHIWPRYDWEDERYNKMPPLCHPDEWRNRPECLFAPDTHRELMDKIKQARLACN